MLDTSKINALIQLLDDPDEQVFTEVRKQIEEYGEDIIPALEHAWESDTLGAVFQSRIEEIIHDIQFEGLIDKLAVWKEGGCMDLLEGWLMVSRYQFPDLNEEQIRKDFEKFKQDIWLELHEGLTALEKVKVINHILFEVHGFSANTKNYHAPSNSFINSVLETKKGNPISLSIIYMILSQELQLPIHGVNLPRHFILCYVDDYEGTIERNEIQRDDILFYINPFGRGSIFTNKEIKQFLKQLELDEHDMFYTPCDNESIIRRIINNLKYSYEKLGFTDKEEEMKRLMEVMKPT